MAAQDKVTFKQDLTEPVKIRHYEGVVFTGDDCGNIIKVALFDGGAPYSGGGTVSATAILADGTTFPLTQGSITGNMVSVPLEAGALAVSGLMGLYVKISGDGIICTVLNAIFTVQATDTGMVPAAMVTTVNELVAAIRDAQDSIPADLTNLLAAVAPTFSTATAYSAGAYVWQGGKLYRFTAAHPAGTWTGTDAVEVALGNDIADLKSALDNPLIKNLVKTMTPRGYDSTTNQYTTNNKWACSDEFTLDRYQFVEVPNGDYQVGWFKLVEGEETTTSGWLSHLTLEPNTRYIFLMRNTSNAAISISGALNAIRVYNGGEMATAASGSVLSSVVWDGVYNVRAEAMSVYSDVPTASAGNNCILNVERFQAGTQVFARQTLSINNGDQCWKRYLRYNGTVFYDWVQLYGEGSELDNEVADAIERLEAVESASQTNASRITAINHENDSENALVYPTYDANIVINTTAETISIEGTMYIQLYGETITSHTPTSYQFLRNATGALFIAYDLTAEKVLFGNGNDIKNYRNTNASNVVVFFGTYDPVRWNLSYSKVPITIDGVRIPFYQQERKFYGKTFSIMGDSVSTFKNYVPSGYATWYPHSGNDVAVYTDTYWGKLMLLQGMQLLVNDSYSGSRLTYISGDTKPYMAGETRVNALGDTAPDYMFILAGGNDVNQKATLGTFTPTLVDLSQVADASASNFADAFKILITRIKTKFPNTRLVILWYHNMSSAPNGDHGGVNYGTQAEYAEIAEQVATFYGAQWIDLRKCGIDMFNNTNFDTGNHPTKAGMQMYYDYIIQHLDA